MPSRSDSDSGSNSNRKSASSSSERKSSSRSNRSKNREENRSQEKGRDNSSMSKRRESEERKNFKTDIFVTGFPPKTEEKDFVDFFQPFGEIKKVHLKYDKMSGKLKRFVFIEFMDEESAAKAIQNCDGKMFMNQPIVVKESLKNRSDRDKRRIIRERREEDTRYGRAPNHYNRRYDGRRGYNDRRRYNDYDSSRRRRRRSSSSGSYEKRKHRKRSKDRRSQSSNEKKRRSASSSKNEKEMVGKKRSNGDFEREDRYRTDRRSSRNNKYGGSDRYRKDNYRRDKYRRDDRREDRRDERKHDRRDDRYGGRNKYEGERRRPSNGDREMKNES